MLSPITALKEPRRDHTIHQGFGISQSQLRKPIGKGPNMQQFRHRGIAYTNLLLLC